MVPFDFRRGPFSIALQQWGSFECVNMGKLAGLVSAYNIFHLGGAENHSEPV